MKAINPATGQILREFRQHSNDQIEERLEAATASFATWRKVAFSERATKMRAAAQILRENAPQYGRLITEEMGKPIRQSVAEVEKCAWVCEYYADHAEEFLAPRPVETDASQSYVRYDPLGPVLAIMPWNFPFWQLFRFAAPALMAGNVGLLKHSANVPGCALAIGEIFLQADFPPGVMSTLLVGSEKVNDIIADPRIRAVTLTGSEAAGRSVASQAGRNLKKTVLELGGSDPFIVLADVDVAEVTARAVQGRTINTGQSCIAAKRFLVEETIADQFEAAFVEQMKQLRIGDPLNDETDIGPLAREDLCRDLHNQVQRSIAAGAKLVLGGKRLDRPGFYYAPTVLTDVKPGMAVFDEETFGPVAAVTRVRDACHAVELANQSPYGLGASIHTRDEQLAHELAANIESGFVAINGIVKSDPRLPFGGVKNSGYGRELADVGIYEFVNIKSVWSS